jgi:pimeloyl-ACP methyl ester carboxylesterase
VADGPAPVHVVGLSGGTQAAAQLACAAPGDVDSLALVGGGSDALSERVVDELRTRPMPTLGVDGSGLLPAADLHRLADELSSFWGRCEDEHQLLDVLLTPGADEVTRARRLVRAAVENAGMSATLRDDAELLTSELVTNALVHATPPARLRVAVRPDAVTVTVHDAGPADEPARRRHHGRGLAIVAGVAARCGQWTDTDGTTTWFWLACDQASGFAEAPLAGSKASHGATEGAAAAPSGHESR